MAEEVLHRDVHPAEVYVPHAWEAPRGHCRVFITDQHVFVWAMLGRPALIFEAPITDPPEKDRGTLFGQITVTTAEGPVHVTKGQGCGCHSPLRALVPPANW